MFISTGLGVAFVFLIFKLFVPHKERVDIDEALLQKNKSKYALYEVLSIFPLFVFTGILIHIVYKAGNGLSKMFLTNESYRFSFIIDPYSWTMPGILLGFGLVVIPMEHLYQAILKDEYPLYLEAANRRHGWDGMKVMKPLSKILISAGTVSFILLFNVSVKVTDQDILINRFLDFSETTYALDDIDEVVSYNYKIAPNGDLVENKQIVFYSNGEEIWSTEITFLGNEPNSFNSMIQFVLDRNSLEMQKRETYNQ